MITKVLSPALNAAVVAIFRGHGQHRRPLLLPDEPVAPTTSSSTVLAEEELLALVPEAPTVQVGAVVASCFDDCPACGKATAGVLTKDGWRCGECLTSVPAGGVSRG